MAQISKKILSNWEPGPRKKTSSSGNPNMIKRSTMSKGKKRSYKKYRGQGR